MQVLKSAYFFCFLGSGLFLHAQEKDPDMRLAIQLDSVAKTTTVARHFATLYRETVLISMQHYQQAVSREKDFIGKFEQTFADYFFRAAANKGAGQTSGAWHSYFNDPSLSPLQYQLLGINAHINADLSAALVECFTQVELQAHKKSFIRFQQGLKVQFYRFYAENIQSAAITRLLDKVPFGLARAYGYRMMIRWRKRQFKLALWHYNNPEKAAALKKKTDRRKERTDRLILHHL